jgi:hypothetical protein
MLAMSSLASARDATMLNVSPMTLWVVIVGGLVLAMAGGLVTFARADVRG